MRIPKPKVDLPGYGQKETPDDEPVRYCTWCHIRRATRGDFCKRCDPDNDAVMEKNA